MNSTLFNTIDADKAIAIKQQVDGYLATHVLWKGSILTDLKQLEFNYTTCKVNVDKPERRLGKRVEQFFTGLIKSTKEYELVCQNIQLKSGKITIGEIDCILKKEGVFYHVEHVYKFYLYDETAGGKELGRWIGPNRKDCLNFKLLKLKGKQLPVLYTDQGKQVLNDFNISIKQVKQRVHFKAQLFIPKTKSVQFNLINPEAVSGVYYRLNELPTDALYAIPSKINWLLKPHENVEWKTFEQGLLEIHEFLNQQKSPLCWVKSSTGVLEKCFVVWW